jgi:hypothetical protein
MRSVRPRVALSRRLRSLEELGIAVPRSPLGLHDIDAAGTNHELRIKKRRAAPPV